MKFNTYFERKFCINLPRSKDRWEHVEMECRKHNLTGIQRFNGYDFKDYETLPDNIRQHMINAMCGCTASHGALLSWIGIEWELNGLDRVLILEDDFVILHDDFHDRFNSVIQQVPEDWQLLYLGAHYGDRPLGRVSPGVVMAGYIKTTSSYAVRGEFARKVAASMHGCGGPDDLLSCWTPISRAYVLQPRLMAQYECMSVVWGQHTNNGPCMTDTRHENMV